MDQKILIDFPAMAAFLGTGLHRLLRHRRELESRGVTEKHEHHGRYYTVCCPDKLNDYWRRRTWE